MDVILRYIDRIMSLQLQDYKLYKGDIYDFFIAR